MTATILTPFGLANAGLSNPRLGRSAGNAAHTTTPAHDLIQTDEQAYRLSVLAPGITRDQIEVEVHDRRLRVTAKAPADTAGATYLRRGILRDELDFTFVLAEHVTVADARLENGLLHVDLVREVPEALKPRSIEVKGTDTSTQIADQHAA